MLKTMPKDRAKEIGKQKDKQLKHCVAECPKAMPPKMRPCIMKAQDAGAVEKCAKTDAPEKGRKTPPKKDDVEPTCKETCEKMVSLLTWDVRTDHESRLNLVSKKKEATAKCEKDCSSRPFSKELKNCIKKAILMDDLKKCK